MLTKMEDQESNPDAQTQAQHRPTAILIGGADGNIAASSTARGKGLADVLRSQGFAVRELGAEAAETGAEEALGLQACRVHPGAIVVEAALLARVAFFLTCRAISLVYPPWHKSRAQLV